MVGQGLKISNDITMIAMIDREGQIIKAKFYINFKDKDYMYDNININKISKFTPKELKGLFYSTMNRLEQELCEQTSFLIIDPEIKNKILLWIKSILTEEINEEKLWEKKKRKEKN